MAQDASGRSDHSILATVLLCLLTVLLTLSLVLSVLYRMEHPRQAKVELPPLPTLPEAVWPESVVVPDGRADRDTECKSDGKTDRNTEYKTDIRTYTDSYSFR